MNTVNWNEVLLRASCAGKVMTEGKGSGITDKQLEMIDTLKQKEKRTPLQDVTLSELEFKRDAPPKLSDTCISYLKEVYIYQKYGKESVGGSERSKYTMKGKAVEDESIMMLSRLDEKEYLKNELRLNDNFFTGEADILYNYNQDTKTCDFIKDIKSSWDFSTLLSNIGSPLNPMYWWQGQVYMELYGAKQYEVAYCLTNMPQDMIDNEKFRIFRILNAVTEESPEYLKAVDTMEFNYTFDEIPISERIVKFPFQKDDAAMEKLKTKWIECRKWLAEFDKKHTLLHN